MYHTNRYRYKKHHFPMFKGNGLCYGILVTKAICPVRFGRLVTQSRRLGLSPSPSVFNI